MLDSNINYDFNDFFIDSIAKQRINAYKIEMPTDADTCTIAYSMPVHVQKNGTFNPAIYLAEQTATGNYKIDYTIELNDKFPYLIESNVSFKKQGNYVYTVENVSDDFYFVFSSTKKTDTILIIVLSIVICFFIILSILIYLHYKNSKTYT